MKNITLYRVHIDRHIETKTGAAEDITAVLIEANGGEDLIFTADHNEARRVYDALELDITRKCGSAYRSVGKFIAAYTVPEAEYAAAIDAGDSIEDICFATMTVDYDYATSAEPATEPTEAQRIAEQIAAADTWDPELCAELCALADMSDEWEAADGETFEQVLYAAAEKLSVEID